MEALCSLRRGAHESIHGWRNPGLLEGAGSSWEPYISEFQRDYGWRPDLRTFNAFDRRTQRDSFFYLHDPRFR